MASAASAPAAHSSATVASILKMAAPSVEKLRGVIGEQRELSATYGVFDDKQIAVLAEALAYSHSLTRLNLDSNKMSHEGLAKLLPALRGHTDLADLNLRNNGFGDKGAEVIANEVGHLSWLSKLNLDNNKIGSEGGKALCKALKNCPHLTEFALIANKLGDEGGAALVHLIVYSKTLRKVKLEGVLLSEEEGKRLGQKLESHHHLTKLNLALNRLNDISTYCAAIANPKCSLISLNLSGNYFEQLNKQASALAAAIATNSSLRKLRLESAEISDAGATAFANALAVNHTLTKLSLGQNPITSAGLTVLADAVRNKNTSLVVLSLKGLKLGDPGAVIAAPLVTRLQKLTLGSCEIGPKGATALAECLATTTTLKSLGLMWNPIENAGGEAIAKALTSNNCTTIVAVTGKPLNDMLKPLLAARSAPAP